MFSNKHRFHHLLQVFEHYYFLEKEKFENCFY